MVIVLGCVAVFRIVAAADVSTNQAFAQVHPFISHFEALFATVRGRDDFTNFGEVRARFYLHRSSRNRTRLTGVSQLVHLAGVCLVFE